MANLTIELLVDDDPRLQLPNYEILKQIVADIRGGKHVHSELNTFLPQYVATVEDIEQNIETYKNSYNGEVIGVVLIHKYRAKNKFGGTEIYEYRFGFDKEVVKIILAEDISAKQ